MYAIYVNRNDYPDIKFGKYGTATITGDIEELALGVEYQVTAEEKPDKYGTGYAVKNIRREKPSSPEQTKAFLREILTWNQAEVLYEMYPDIVERVMKNKLDDIDLSKTHGIKEYTFNVIKNKIVSNFKLAELVDEFQGIFSITVLKRLYEQYPSIAKIKEKLRTEPYECLCRINGIGFKTADDMLLKIYDKSKRNEAAGDAPIIYFHEDLRTSYQRMLAAVEFILAENETSGNTYMNVRDFKRECTVLAHEADINLAKVLNSKFIHFDKDNLRVALQYTFEIEEFIANKINQSLAIKPEKWKVDINKYRSLGEFDLTDDQMKTMEYVCENNITILCGFGGSGKTASTTALINLMDENHISYQLMAPTGRASKVLSNYTGKPASTIHRGLAFKPPFEWGYNAENPIRTDVVVVDEFSMTDIFICQKLLDAIDFNNTRLLVIGDDAQIPSVGAGNVLYDLLHCEKIPTVMLDKIFRYGAGGLATAATDTRMSKKYLSEENGKMQVFGEDKSYVFFPLKQEKILGNTVALYKKLLGDGYKTEDISVLSCYNIGEYGTEKINNAIQKAVNPNDDLTIKCGDTEYRIGDNVIQCVNDYKAIQAMLEEDMFDEKVCYRSDETSPQTWIFNGEIGKIIHIEENKFIVVQYDDGLKIKYPKSKLVQLKLAYSISTHKSQGGQFKVVILITPKAHTFMLNSNLLYVGISRSQEKCFHIGQTLTINKAIKKKENFDRKTYLGELIKKGVVNNRADDRTENQTSGITA